MKRERQIDELVSITVHGPDGPWEMRVSWMTASHLALNPKVIYNLQPGDYKRIADVNQAAADTVHAIVRALLHVRCMSRVRVSNGPRQA